MEPKKRILHLIQSLDNGGCENMLLRTLPLLDTFEHRIIALKELGELAPKFVTAGITVETIHCSSLLDLSGIQRLRTLIREENPHLIITYLFHADMISRLTLRTMTKAPIVPFLRTTYNHPKYFVARLLEWSTRPLVSQYLANSIAVKDFYTKSIGVRPERITVIPSGVDVTYFDSLVPNPQIKQSLSIKPDDFLIICVANLAKNKGHRYLLEAFESLEFPHLKLLLVGDGTERKSLEQQVTSYRSKKNILFLGKRADVPQLLKIANTFVLPTLFEGQSNAILEAMAAGLPIITTDISENRVLIKNNVSGKLIPPQSSSALAQALREILHDRQGSHKLGEEAHLVAQESFSLPTAAKKFESIFLSLL